jgi:uncharacterized protein YjbJ (UPF0337 family)
MQLRFVWEPTAIMFVCPTARHFAAEGDHHMDKDRTEGIGHQVKGAVKEAAGKLTGDTKTQAEGNAEKNAGKVQNAIGGAKDGVREALNKG